MADIFLNLTIFHLLLLIAAERNFGYQPNDNSERKYNIHTYSNLKGVSEASQDPIYPIPSYIYVRSVMPCDTFDHQLYSNFSRPSGVVRQLSGFVLASEVGKAGSSPG